MKPAIERAASVRTGPAEIAFTRMFLRRGPRRGSARRLERRLGDAHDVVVGHGALAAEVGHRHDRAAAGASMSGSARPGAGDERVGADVEREPEAVARRVGEAALEVLRGGEGDRVDEDVEPAAERLRDLGKTASTSSSERTSHSVTSGLETVLGELAHALLDPLALVREGELRALVCEALRDRPGDRALVGDAEDERAASPRTCRRAAILNG